MKKLTVFLACLMLLGMLPVAAATPNTGTLAGKTALFAGDSIGAGWRDMAYGKGNYSNGGGWALRLEKEYYMVTTKVANAGAAFAPFETRTRIVPQLTRGTSYDYVILQGGFNDMMGENPKPGALETVTPLGTVSDSFDPADFDTTTFSGAFEELLYTATTYYPGARIGFIITYKTPDSSYGGITDGVTETAEGYKQQDYIDRQIEICEKWKVPYLDLWGGKTADGRAYSGDVIDVDGGAVHFPGGDDCIHLNTEGYNAVTPHVALWMASLEHHPGVTTTTTTTTTTTATTTTTTTTGTATTTTAKPTGTTTTTGTATTTAKPTGTTTTTGTVTGAVTPTTTKPDAQDNLVSDPSVDNTSGGLYVILGIVLGVAALAAAAVVIVLYIRKKQMS